MRILQMRLQKLPLAFPFASQYRKVTGNPDAGTPLLVVFDVLVRLVAYLAPDVQIVGKALQRPVARELHIRPAAAGTYVKVVPVDAVSA